MRLPDLPVDVLSLVCERIVRSGEAFWFAATCRAARAAVGVACDRLHLPLCSKASTAFVSLERLELGMGLLALRKLVHANMNAASSGSRPTSLDRKYVWSPLGERVLAARAPATVLDYAWAGWRLSCDARNPGCFLAALCAAGRVDLLWEMDRPATEQGLNPARSGRTLHRRLDALSVSTVRCDPLLQWVEDALMVPALTSGNTAAIRWYYDRMDQNPRGGLNADQVDASAWIGAPLWRSAIGRQTNDLPMVLVSCSDPLQKLARAAALGNDPYTALQFLQLWMWPRMGSRAAQEQRRAALSVATAAVLCSLDSTRAQTAQAWQWLQSTAPQGAATLLELLRCEGNVHTGPLLVKIWLVRHVEVYRWMQARFGPGQWLHDLAKTSLSNETTNGSMRLIFARDTLVAISQRRTDQQEYNPEASWELDRALCVLALTDALVWSWEWPELRAGSTGVITDLVVGQVAWHERLKASVGEHAEALLEHDPGALVDALCDVTSRDAAEFGGGRRRELVLEYVSENCVRSLLQPGSGCNHGMHQRLRAAGLC